MVGSFVRINSTAEWRMQPRTDSLMQYGYGGGSSGFEFFWGKKSSVHVAAVPESFEKEYKEYGVSA